MIFVEINKNRSKYPKNARKFVKKPKNTQKLVKIPRKCPKTVFSRITLKKTTANHSKPLHFRFWQIDGEVVMQMKSSCRVEWKTCNHHAMAEIPNSAPEVLVPNHFDKTECKLLQDNIFKYKYHLLDSQFWWWKRIIDEVSHLQTSPQALEQYFEAYGLLPSLKQLYTRAQESMCRNTVYVQLQGIRCSILG